MRFKKFEPSIREMKTQSWVMLFALLHLLIFPFQSLNAQTIEGLRAYYPFENCDAIDVSNNNSDGIMFGNPSCECGVSGNALFLNGTDDYLVFAGNVESYFEQDEFTMSLYFRTADLIGTHDIISKRENCDFDAVFAVRYTPSSSTISVEIANSLSERTSFIEQIDPNLCWIHVAVVKDRFAHRIFINGALIASQDVTQLMDITNTAPLQVGNSPCIGSTDRRFHGFIDEVRIYNRPLSVVEIADLYLRPDRIATRDTTIYQGGAASLRAGTSCATQFSWSPAGDVQNPSSASTLATPSSTRTFRVEYQYGGCTASDTVLVNVIDPSEIECGNLPMPNAFTPNGDGKNDAFFISNPFTLETLKAFEIFDRLGNKVFSTATVSDSWDGRFRGKEANPGLFLYKVKYTCQGKDLVKTGSVMLIR